MIAKRGLAIGPLATLLMAAIASGGDSRALREARSENGEFELRIEPGSERLARRPAARLLERERGSLGRELWVGELVNEVAPAVALIQDDARWVVTLDEFRLGGARHALVIYDERGRLARELELPELLRGSDWKQAKRRGQALVWLPGAKFAFAPDADHFEIRLRWGTTLTIDLRRGTVATRAKADHVDEPLQAESDDESADVVGDMLDGLAALLGGSVDEWEDRAPQSEDGLTPADESSASGPAIDGDEPTRSRWLIQFGETRSARLFQCPDVSENDDDLRAVDSADAAPGFPAGPTDAIGEAIGNSSAESIARELGPQALLGWVPNSAGNSLDAGLPVPSPDPKNPVDYIQWYKDYVARGDPRAGTWMGEAAAQYQRFTADGELSDAVCGGQIDAILDPRTEAWLAANRDAIDLWLAGAKLDYRGMPIDATEGPLAGILLPSLGSFLALGRSAVIDGWHEFHSGNPGGGVSRVLDTLNAGSTVSYGITPIENLVGAAIQRTASEALLDMLDQGGERLDYSGLARRVEESYRPTRPMAEAVQLERATTLDTLQRAFAYNESLGEYTIAPGAAYSLAETLALMRGTGGVDFSPVALMAWQQRGFPALLAQANQNYDAMTQALQNPYPQAAAQLRELNGQLFSPVARYTDPLLTALTPDLASAAVAAAGAESNRRAAALVASLQAYRQTNGGYPDTLDAFAGRGFETDPFTGASFRYRREGDTFVLYSIGSDGVDDGGAHAPKDEPGADRVYWPRRRPN